jgi:hypothetical protein
MQYRKFSRFILSSMQNTQIKLNNITGSVRTVQKTQFSGFRSPDH